MRDPRNFVGIVTYKDSVVGCLLCKHFVSGKNSFFQVYYMAISTNFIGKNLGTFLMDKLIKLAKKHNVHTILA